MVRGKKPREQPSINEHTCSRHLRIHPGMKRAPILPAGGQKVECW